MDVAFELLSLAQLLRRLLLLLREGGGALVQRIEFALHVEWRRFVAQQARPTTRRRSINRAARFGLLTTPFLQHSIGRSLHLTRALLHLRHPLILRTRLGLHLCQITLQRREIAIRLVALLLKRREQLARGLELGFKTRIRSREGMLLRTAKRTRLSVLQIMTMLVKTSHQLRLPRHLALRFERLREPLLLGPIRFHLRSAFSGLFRQHRRLHFRLGDLLVQRLSLRMALPAFGELFKGRAPFADGHAQFRQTLCQLGIRRVSLQPRFECLRGFNMRDERLFSGFASCACFLLLFCPGLISGAALHELFFKLIALCGHASGLLPNRLACRALLLRGFRRRFGLHDLRRGFDLRLMQLLTRLGEFRDLGDDGRVFALIA